MDPTSRLAFTVRCGLRVRGLMEHPVVAAGVDIALRLAREVCLRGEADDGILEALAFVKRSLDDRNIPGVANAYVFESSAFQVEACAVARVYQVVDYNHSGDDKHASLHGAMAALSAQDAIQWSRLPEREVRRWLAEAQSMTMADLDRRGAARGKGPLDPLDQGPWGPVWPGKSPAWFAEVEGRRPLTNVTDREIKLFATHAKQADPMEPKIADLQKALTSLEGLEAPSRIESRPGKPHIIKEVAEAEAAIRRASELILLHPEIAEQILPAIGDLSRRLEESGHLMWPKAVADLLKITPARVNQLAKLGRLPFVTIFGVIAFSRSTVEQLAGSRRPPGRPRRP